MNDTPTNTQTTPTSTPQIDYDALAQQAGAIESSAAAKPTSTKEWVPRPGDPVAHIQMGDGSEHHIHGDDLAEAQKRDPNLKVIAPPSPHQPDYDALAKQAGAIQQAPQLSSEQTLSRTLQNMTSAVSGQPMQNPDDQAEAERGRKAGTIQGGVDIAAGFLLGPALEFLGFGGGRATQQATKEGVKVATGILDEHGNEIFREVAPEAKQVAGKILKHPIVEKAVKMAVKKIIGEEAGRRVGKSVGGEPGGYAGATLGALVGDKVLNWILAD